MFRGCSSTTISRKGLIFFVDKFKLCCKNISIKVSYIADQHLHLLSRRAQDGVGSREQFPITSVILAILVTDVSAIRVPKIDNFYLTQEWVGPCSQEIFRN